MEKEKNLKLEIINECLMVFWIFIVGSIIGFLLEMGVGLFQNGHFVSRKGLLFGPFTPVYGVGLAIYYLLFFRFKERDNETKAFFVSMIAGGVVEYIFSYLQEKLFGTISWDYSNIPFNINGRTSLLHCTYWGIGGILFVKYIYPYIVKCSKVVQGKKFRLLSCILAIYMVINISLSFMASIRQKERMLKMQSNTVVDVFLDKYFPDEVMDRVFENKKEKITDITKK